MWRERNEGKDNGKYTGNIPTTELLNGDKKRQAPTGLCEKCRLLERGTQLSIGRIPQREYVEMV